MAVGKDYDPRYGFVDHVNSQPQFMHQLPVSDIERLAKAGVVINIGNVVPVCDPTPVVVPETRIQSIQSLEDAIWDRWYRTKAVKGHRDFGYELPFKLLASQHGDKVWVSLHPANSNYEPFQIQDDAVIFPSDALMAQLALWEQHHK